jgi:hypothetical protein
LVRPVAELGLLAGDRLEPSTFLPDVAAFDGLDTFPFPVLFWRRSAETNTRHRNPLFMPDIGVSVVRSLTVDSLHCIYLGVMHSFCRYVVWHLMLSGSWGGVGTADEVVTVAVEVFRISLVEWYKARARSFLAENLTRVQDVTPTMVGTVTNKRLKTKGAETWGILLFLIEALGQHLPRLGADGGSAARGGALLEHANGYARPRGAPLDRRSTSDVLGRLQALPHVDKVVR